MPIIVGKHPLIPPNTGMCNSVTTGKLSWLIPHISLMSFIAFKSSQVMFSSGTLSVQLINRSLTHSRACF